MGFLGLGRFDDGVVLHEPVLSHDNKSKTVAFFSLGSSNDDASDAPMPWESDPDLADLSATELLDIFSDPAELTFRERARLHEMCVRELEAVVRDKSKRILSILNDHNVVKKELERANMKLKAAGSGSASGEAEKSKKVLASGSKSTSSLKAPLLAGASK